MTLVVLPYRAVGSDVRSIEGIMSDLDAILSTINGNLDDSNFADGVVIQKQVAVQTTPSAGLTNVALATPTSPCSVTVVLPTAACATISLRAIVDKTSGLTHNTSCALFMDGAVMLDSEGVGGNIRNQGGNIPPTISMMFQSGDPVHGISAPIVSGAGDWSSQVTGQMIAPPIDIYVPSGTHTFALAYGIDAGGIYTVVSQSLAIKI